MSRHGKKRVWKKPPLAVVVAVPVTAVLVVAFVALGQSYYSTADDTGTPVVPPASASSASASPLLAPTSAPPVQSTVDRLSEETCAFINTTPSSTGVWQAAAALESGPAAVDVNLAWSSVLTFVTYDCPQHAQLVADTIEDVTNGDGTP